MGLSSKQKDQSIHFYYFKFQTIQNKTQFHQIYINIHNCLNNLQTPGYLFISVCKYPLKFPYQYRKDFG